MIEENELNHEQRLRYMQFKNMLDGCEPDSKLYITLKKRLNDELRFCELENRLKAEGCPVSLGGNIGKGFVFPKEYDHIILEYLGTFENDHLNSHLLHVITKNKKYSLIPILLDLFYDDKNDGYRWTIGDCLCSIGYKDKYFDDYMNIARNSRYGSGRQMVVLLIGKSKRREACEILLHQMNSLDLNVILHTIAALKYFKDENVFGEVKAFADYLISEDGKKFYSEKAFEFYSEYDYDKIDVQQCYRALLRELNKILIRNDAEIKKEDMILYPKNPK